jgi:phosphatidylglycerol---prolipoprotein diacylglyceryl transferase
MIALRAYPAISDFVNDVFGTNVQWPIQSFGFFVAIAFLVAAWLLRLELIRKENLGLMQSTDKKVKVGEPASFQDLAVNGIIGFVIGFKLLFAIFNYSSCASNPQAFVFSSAGSFLGGLIGAAIAIYLKYAEKKKQQLKQPKWETIKVYPHHRVGDIVVIAAIAGFTGAKIFNFLEVPADFDLFLQNPGENLFSGLTIYGGLIIGGIAVLYYALKNKIKPLHLTDAVAPGLILAYGIGRIGCQVSGDGDWGIPNLLNKPNWLSWLPDSLWSNNFAHNIINEGTLIPGCEGDFCHQLVPGVFPTPIYETVMAAAIFGFLWYMRKKTSIPGVITALYLIFNGIERFFIEKIRVNVKYEFGNIHITQAEIISVIFFLSGLIMLLIVIRNARMIKDKS